MKRSSALIVAVVWILAGCTPGEEPTTPPATGPTLTLPPAVTPNPPPQWSAQEQAAIDAVYRYRDVSQRIAQHLDSADWNDIRGVAGDTEATGMLDLWAQWRQSGWHLVGESEFLVDYVNPGMNDAQGTRYVVVGCYQAAGSYLADAQGNPAGPRQEQSSTTEYHVLHAIAGGYQVIDSVMRETPC
jgi:hypothetical protein